MSHIASFDLIILFFILGVLASWFRSDLEVPEQVAKFLSIFLLLSLGLKGGHEVRVAENLSGFFPSLLIGLTSCLALPIAVFYFLKNRLGMSNAAALAASYGSVSAVTFITAQSILENNGIPFSGFMVAVMAIMEIPAILIGVFLYQRYSKAIVENKISTFVSIFSTKSVVLLIGGFVIGLAMNEVSWQGISPVVQGCFKGFLAFFLLDLGVLAQKQLREAWKFKSIGFAVSFLLPILFGSLALIAGHIFGLSSGNAILTSVLVGSASYIAAPATVRSTMPEANPSLYLALPLTLTFPMNLLLGIPFYVEASKWLSNL
ncbi:MAG: sodium-dependent bicarbonate transport family permease [Bdellovibrionaceae bacterium]|nr:sodium-dependent bicarbonate transport family permease [Pseudobdellovibrionaceae bacterium]